MVKLLNVVQTLFPKSEKALEKLFQPKTDKPTGMQVTPSGFNHMIVHCHVHLNNNDGRVIGRVRVSPFLLREERLT